MQVLGARPAANVTWYNTSRILDPETEELSGISTKTVCKAFFLYIYINYTD